MTGGYFASEGTVQYDDPSEKTDLRLGAEYDPADTNWTFLAEISRIEYYQTQELDRSEIGTIYVGARLDFGAKGDGKTDDIDRIVGLEIGADDYVTKPFNPRELLARVTNLLRRIHTVNDAPVQHKSIYHFDNLVLDASRRLLLGRDEEEIKLTRAEFELLLVFMTHPGQVLNRDRLLSQVTHRSWDPNDRTIDVLIMRLRRKIERDYKQPILFATVHGEGYLFSGLDEHKGS